LGIKLALAKKQEFAQSLLLGMKDSVGADLVETILKHYDHTEGFLINQRKSVAQLKQVLSKSKSPEAKVLYSISDSLLEKSVWIIGGDGWAYDIGFGGLDHVISTGEKVNILVLDTEVYSNTGGQTSKASPLGASAKFSITGKLTAKKDLAWQAISYGNTYVAQIAFGANDLHTVRILQEAEAFNGPSLVIAYSHCIAHGYDMGDGVAHQVSAVKSGYWPLFHYNPSKQKGERFVIDSKEPTIPVSDFMHGENRFEIIRNTDPTLGAEFIIEAQEGISHEWEKLIALKVL
jgi:pyruvate-ferredoxin/flavodoxin oxidoreductase